MATAAFDHSGLDTSMADTHPIKMQPITELFYLTHRYKVLDFIYKYCKRGKSLFKN